MKDPHAFAKWNFTNKRDGHKVPRRIVYSFKHNVLRITDYNFKYNETGEVVALWQNGCFSLGSNPVEAYSRLSYSRQPLTQRKCNLRRRRSQPINKYFPTSQKQLFMEIGKTDGTTNTQIRGNIETLVFVHDRNGTWDLRGSDFPLSDPAMLVSYFKRNLSTYLNWAFLAWLCVRQTLSLNEWERMCFPGPFWIASI